MRRRLRKGVARVRRRALGPRHRAGAVILGYHRVAAPNSDPFGLCVRPERFREHLDVIRRVTEPVRLRSVPDALRAERTPRGHVAVVTFDDGYADVMWTGLPLLEEAAIPATVFAISGALGSIPWWDRLAASVRSLDPGIGGSIPIGDRTFRWRAGTSGDRLLDRLIDRIAPLSAESRDEIIDRIGPSGHSPAESGETRGAEESRLMTASELRRLADSSLIDVGAHSSTHPLLTRVDPVRLRAETLGCRRSLETILERPVMHFAYPHGRQNRRVRRAVDSAGFEVACTSLQDVVRRGDDPVALPRIWPPNLPGPAFESWLRTWIG